MKKPNGYYYWIAKEFLKRAYKQSTANSFFSMNIKRKGNYTIVECGNGGGCIDIKIADDHISRRGHYSKHRYVDKVSLLKQANELLDANEIPTYYSVTFKEGITTYERCIESKALDKAKRDVIKIWNCAHSTSQISEPINWVIKEV